jgi:YfiH family protein
MSLSVLTPSYVLQAPELEAGGMRHGFFTRQGGVSTGLYASLNGGVGSKDDAAHVAENRARMAAHLHVDAAHLLVPYQIHSAEALLVEAPFTGERPRCDGFATATRGLALGVTGADCGIVLFADSEAKVIGAAHAGWKGALTGVLEATLVAMERLGAQRNQIRCVLGPAIGPASYEVGPEFVARFVDVSPHFQDFFKPSAREGHSMFNLPGFIGARLTQAGVRSFTDLGLDTYADETRFFSYRRSVHRNEPDYGRQIAAISLPKD